MKTELKVTPAGVEYLKRYTAKAQEAVRRNKSLKRGKKSSKVAQTPVKLQKGESVAEKLRRREVVAVKFANMETTKALRQLGMKPLGQVIEKPVSSRFRAKEVLEIVDAKTTKALRQLGMKVEVLANGHACLYVGANLVEFELNDHETMRQIVVNLHAHFMKVIEKKVSRAIRANRDQG